ncbi:MAG: hypothetical protein LBI82_04780 [Dysgonamonadaceae bacterium]|nr:hypothetical protein [Dysgonamonadaceae bacterium]
MPQNQNSPSTLGESPGGPSRGWWEGGEPDDPTGGNLGERDKVRGGVPIKDALWLLPFLAIGYGIYCRQRERGKN